jgi:glycerol-3-phosphate acyltransferase PlsY
MSASLIILSLIVAYVIGGLPCGLWVGLARGVDIRQLGSRNIGASNVLRVLGAKWGAVAFLGDVLKGTVAVLIVKWAASAAGLEAGAASYVLAGGALCAVVGHDWSVWLKFQGGKGVATNLGVALVLDWRVALIAFGIWIALTAVSRYISLASMFAVASTVFLGLAFHSPPAAIIFFIITSAITIARHHENIGRLLTGTERRIGQRVPAAAEPTTDRRPGTPGQ